ETLLAVDEAVGAIVELLERLGLSDDTAVVFTSDNGFMWSEHWWVGKLAGFEESIRVPLVIRYPVLTPTAAARDDLVLNVDLAPDPYELQNRARDPAYADVRALLAARLDAYRVE